MNDTVLKLSPEQKLPVFKEIVSLLLYKYIQGHFFKDGRIIFVDNVVMMKLLYFFAFYGCLFKVFDNMNALRRGHAEMDLYSFLVNNPGFLGEQYSKALQKLAGKSEKERESQEIDDDELRRFSNDDKLLVRSIINVMWNAGIFREDKDGLVELCHESGAWLHTWYRCAHKKIKIEYLIAEAKREQERLLEYSEFKDDIENIKNYSLTPQS